MNGDKVVERDKILQVMEKYRDYFKEWNADVAFGTNKSNIFYVLAPRNEFETFLFFQTADQLERIILGTIAENVEIIMEAGIEEISIGFSADKMDGEYGKSIEHYLPGLVHKLDVICKTGEEWQNMMRVTFDSLKNVCAEIAEKNRKMCKKFQGNRGNGTPYYMRINFRGGLFMKQGTLFYDKQSGRYNFHYTDEDGDRRDYGGIHCGEVFEFRLNDVWVPVRVEMGMDDKWYLVGLPGLTLDGLEVRQE